MKQVEVTVPDPTLMHAALAAPLVGSFLGMLVTRLPAGRRVVVARSCCDHCGHGLSARDLVPIFSWLVNRARCRYCSAQLSVFYPGIELAAVLVVVWAAAVLSGWLLWASCGLGWVLLTLAVIDQRTMLLPDALTLPLIPAGLLAAWLIEPAALPGHVIGAAAGYAVFRLAAVAYAVLRGREGLGLGDAKLMAAAGAWLSWQAIPSVVLFAAVGGLALAAGRAALHGALRADERMPFGPCICSAMWIVWLYGPIGLA